MKSFLTSIAALALMISSGSAQEKWHDDFYQYRFPVTVTAASAGWHIVPISPSQITQLVNQNEELAFDALWFANNFLQVVDVTGDQAGPGTVAKAGFFLIPAGDELIPDGVLGHKETIDVPVEKEALYLLRYTARGAGHAPTYRYEAIFPVGSPLRDHACFTSHEPRRMLPLGLSKREQLILSDGKPLRLDLAGRFVHGIESISLKKVDILFLADIPESGERKWMVYYQPTTGHHLILPQRRRNERPSQTLQVALPSRAEKLWGRTAYRLPETDLVQTWFAETTRKLTPATTPPPAQSDQIEITAAANERQSFQLVVALKTGIRLEGLTATPLHSDQGEIPAELVAIQQAEFVPIRESSYITPVKYVGPLADPLTKVQPRDVLPQQGNVVYWITVQVPSGGAAGKYKGSIELKIAGQPAVHLPVHLEVYDFELSEFSPFRTSFGGAHIAKSTFSGEKTVADYHGMVAKDDIKKLARAYFDAMAVNKATPHSVAQFSEIGMNWTPPPRGLNVDKPGNFFELHDWDFSELNADLRHYIDELKVNAFAIVHTNPTAITSFAHLPGKKLDQYDRHPSHVTLAWQAFREMTTVGYAKREVDEYQEITKEQFDRLVMDFYVALAENLDKHGWLDFAYIMLDETADRGYEPLLDFMRLLKSHPLTARIKFVWCLQEAGAFNHKENPDDTNYAFRDLVDVYVPETNENCYFWQKYLFSDYGIPPRRDHLWNYITYTTRTAIDTPGINNRMIAMEVFHNGGGGFLNWGSFIWDSPVHAETRGGNPWQDPYSRWGNGAITYFYPPSKSGPVSAPDRTVVPSLRLETYRESVDDYEYAWLLEKLIEEGRSKGLDVSLETELLGELERFFPSTTIWSQNDAWYLQYRDRLARAIVDLQKRIAGVHPSQSGADG